MYSVIYDPVTQQKHPIHSKKGISLLKKYIMIGGAKCSICEAKGVTKATCPLNPKSKNPNPEKHNSNKVKKIICKKYKKNKPPKCNDQSECEWEKKSGCKNKKKSINKSVKKKSKALTTGKAVLFDEVSMLNIRQFRHNMQLSITKDILDKFIGSKGYFNLFKKYLRKLLDSNVYLERPARFSKPYIIDSICNGFKKTKEPKCDDQELCEWGNTGSYNGNGCKISADKLAKRNATFPWYLGWRDYTTDFLWSDSSFATIMDNSVIEPEFKQGVRWKRNKNWDVWNWGHLLYKNKISGLSVQFKSGKKNTQNTYKKVLGDVEKYVRRKSKQTKYINKRDLINKLKDMVYEGLSPFKGVNLEPIPFDFAKTKVGKSFATNNDNLETWIKYKTHNNNIPIIVWGSRKTDPIKEEYVA